MEITGENISEVWEKTVASLLKNGKYCIYNTRRVLEIDNVLLSINKLDNEEISRKFIYNSTFLKLHSNLFLQDNSNNRTYKRIYKYGKYEYNQVNKVIQNLIQNPKTKDAIILAGNPEEDMFSNVSSPCLIYMHFYISDYKLCLNASMKITDVWLDLLPDIFQNVTLLKMIASEIKLPIGQYNHYVSNAFIYYNDLCLVKKIF